MRFLPTFIVTVIGLTIAEFILFGFDWPKEAIQKLFFEVIGAVVMYANAFLLSE